MPTTRPPQTLYDPEIVRRTLRLAHPPGDVIEIRMPKAGKLRTISGYFDNIDAVVNALAPYTRQLAIPAVYFTLNPINPALLARAANVLKPYAEQTTADSDITRRVLFGLDFDPSRPAGISASEAEHQAALVQADRCREWLAAIGWPDPIYGDSGNGAHLLYHIDLPNNDEARQLIQQVLAALDLFHSTETIKLDLTVSNAARVWKLFGTMAQKGSNIADRPHRLSRILEAPEQLTAVTYEQLTAVAQMAPIEEPKGPQSASNRKGPQSPLDLAAWIKTHNLEVRRQKPWNGGMLYELAVCPWNPEHTHGEASSPRHNILYLGGE
jgi:hypothetical protein